MVAAQQGYRINTTASAPKGLWHLEPIPARLVPGMLVLACLPSNALARMALRRAYVGPGRCGNGLEPLLKPVAAIEGDVVEISREGISINRRMAPNSTALEHDSASRELPGIPIGTYSVQPGEVWLLSSHSPESFDSRYFGGIPVANIQGLARPIWTWN
jgi:conjugative transfer signal peptidase TraF